MAAIEGIASGRHCPLTTHSKFVKLTVPASAILDQPEFARAGGQAARFGRYRERAGRARTVEKLLLLIVSVARVAIYEGRVEAPPHWLR